MNRSHTCGQLTKKDLGRNVRLAGWVHSTRDHGGVIFTDLRDRYGFTQIVFDPSHNKETHKIAERLGREYVISVKGKVRERPEGMENPKLPTGQVEVIVDELLILSKSEVPPIEIDERIEAADDLRLKYRYLDLRRPNMQRFMEIRHKSAFAVREYFGKNGFLEIETPVLVRSTPEGARDYIVPSRVAPGKFYALPQSPQLYKQILMVAGIDRYFQLARCLRDEDLRADRQPEHTQIDFEMSFVDEGDIRRFVEGLYKHLLKKVIGVDVKIPFQEITYEDAIGKYGSDKPDLRFGLELVDVTDVVRESDFKVFKDAEQVKCIVAEKTFGRNDIDELIDWTTKHGAKGLAWMRVTSEGLESSIVKYFSQEVQNDLLRTTKAPKGATLFFIADRPKMVAYALGQLRVEIARRMGLVKEGSFSFCWITDFPLFEWDDENGGWEASHHIFTMPKNEHISLLGKNPEKVRAKLYDLVLNGIELGSGSIRITDPGLQQKVMRVIGMGNEEAERRFGFLLEAFKYGAPPHGGMGIGFDRTVALMCGFNDIRDVIAFPKNKKAENPMDGSPSGVDEKQLRELNIKPGLLKK